MPWKNPSFLPSLTFSSLGSSALPLRAGMCGHRLWIKLILAGVRSNSPRVLMGDAPLAACSLLWSTQLLRGLKSIRIRSCHAGPGLMCRPDFPGMVSEADLDSFSHSQLTLAKAF